MSNQTGRFLAISATALLVCTGLWIGTPSAWARDPVQQKINTAQRALDRGRTAEADAVLHQVIGDAPDNPEAYYMLGTVYDAQGKPEAAKDEYKHYIQIRQGHLPQDPELLLNLRHHGLF